jgi:DNA-binding MarR family transcriptional regulator
MGSVAALLAMDRTTLTAGLKPLERRGLLTVAANPDDKRSRLLALTSEGHLLLARALPIWERTHADVDQMIAKQEGAEIRAVLLALS